MMFVTISSMYMFSFQPFRRQRTRGSKRPYNTQVRQEIPPTAEDDGEATQEKNIQTATDRCKQRYT